MSKNLLESSIIYPIDNIQSGPSTELSTRFLCKSSAIFSIQCLPVGPFGVLDTDILLESAFTFSSSKWVLSFSLQVVEVSLSTVFLENVETSLVGNLPLCSSRRYCLGGSTYSAFQHLLGGNICLSS